jgi:GT2 family glycosyltransferase
LEATETSLVITAHRHGPMLEQCLQAVASLDPTPGEVVVVVDGSEHSVAQAARAKGFEVLVLENAPGVSAARNAGGARARGKFLLLLDSDVLPKRDHVANALAALKSRPGAVAAFGCYDDSPAAPGLISRYRNLLHHFTHFHANRDAQSFWAACGICDAEVFRQVGGFDETYRNPSIEDIALGYKLRRAGHRIALDPSWQIKHLKQWTWRDLVFTDIARRAIPWTLLLLREGRLDNDLNIDTRSRWSALLVMAFLATLAGVIFSPWLLAISAACLAGAIFLNRRFYQFLAGKEGSPFALGAIPLHLFYYLAATIGWVCGYAIFVLERMRWRN